MLRSVENAGPSPAAAARSASHLLACADVTEAPSADAAPPGEAEAWAEVLAGWNDEARHRAYLDRFDDLEGLAAAGRRYRGALLARPGDAMAARQRDEVLRRALAQGLASLPRTAPAARSPIAVRAAALAVLGALVAAAAIALRSIGLHLGAAP